MSNKNFLHTIVAPSLTDSNFGQSIQTQFDNINTNFQRLVSAAYLSGQDGNDVVVKDVPIYTDVITFIDRTTNEVNVYNTIDVITEFLNADVVNYDFVIANKAEDKYAFLYSILQQAVFTDFGLQLVETIFSRQFELTYRRITSTVDGVEVVHSNLGYVLINEDLEQVFPSYSDTNKYPVWLSLVCSPLVRMFAIHDIDTDTTTNICATQLYYFYDARIGSIQLLDDKYTANDFTDYTSFITISSEKNADGDYEINGTYTMSKSQDLPTMYYDNDAQEFCWKMNGIETNITAQGVKGDKGDSAGCWFCRGVADTIQENTDPMISVRLTTYYTTNETGDLMLRSVTAEDCEIKNGDFVCVDVYNSDTTNNSTYFDTIFGNVEVGTQVTGDSAVLVYRVVRPYYTSVMSMINNSPTLFYDYLTRISTRSSGNLLPDTLHGLFIPSTYQGRPTNPEPFLHAINVYPRSSTSINDILMIHPVDINDMFGQINSEIPTKMVNMKPEIHIDGYLGVVLEDGVQFKMSKGDSSGEYINVKDTLALINRPVGSKYITCETSKELYDSLYYTPLPYNLNETYNFTFTPDEFKKSVALSLDTNFITKINSNWSINPENLGSDPDSIKYSDPGNEGIKRSVIFEMITKGRYDNTSHNMTDPNNYYRYKCVFNFAKKTNRDGKNVINREMDATDSQYEYMLQSYNIFKAMTLLKSKTTRYLASGMSSNDFKYQIYRSDYTDNGYTLTYIPYSFAAQSNGGFSDVTVDVLNNDFILGNLVYIYDDENANVIIRMHTSKYSSSTHKFEVDKNDNGVYFCEGVKLFYDKYSWDGSYYFLSKKLLPIPIPPTNSYFLYNYESNNAFYNGQYNVFNWPNSLITLSETYLGDDRDFENPIPCVELFYMNFDEIGTDNINNRINSFDPLYSMVIKEII